MLILVPSFRLRLTALFGGLALIAGLAITLYVEREASQHMTAASGEKLQGIARSVASTLSDSLSERVREVQLISRRSILTEGDWREPHVRAFLDDVKYTYAPYAWVGLANAAGEVIAAADGQLKGQDVSARPWFLHARDGTYIGDVHEAVLLAKLMHSEDPTQPLRFIDFATPIFAPDGRFRGVIATHAHWTWVNTVVEDAVSEEDVGNGIEIMVLGKDGAVLYPLENIAQGTTWQGRLPRRGYAVVDWDDSGKHLSARFPVKEPPAGQLEWEIVLRQPIELALVSVAELRHGLLVMGFLVSVLFMSLAYFVAAGFSRPLEELVRVARRIDRGDESASFPERSRIRELRHLFESLRGMTSTLIRRGHELRSLNLSLEKKVSARTAELEEANRKLEALSATDALTGLANRRRFDQVLAQEWARAGRTEQCLGILLLDVDHFKQYNDHYGHPAGDACLEQVAALLKASVRRSGDLLARYGGEEFVVVVANATRDGSIKLAESIRAAVESAALAHELSPCARITVSIGVAVAVATPSEAAGELVEKADQALYRAKEAGRNRVSE